MHKVVAIIGSKDDLHVVRVGDEIKRLGGGSVVFDTYSAGHLSRTFFLPGHVPSIDISIPQGDRLGSNEPHAIWRRQKPKWMPSDSTPQAAAYETFAQEEWRVYLRGMSLLKAGPKWVNEPSAQLTANNKVYQLALASKVGFLVPETCITNDPVAVADLFKAHERVIYKPLHWFVFPEERVVFTNEISLAQVIGGALSIARNPGIYQKYIDKEFEIRSTIVGDNVYSCRIDAPRSGESSVDWRHSQFEDIFSGYELPIDTKERLLEFHSLSGLSMATYDMIMARISVCFFWNATRPGNGYG